MIVLRQKNYGVESKALGLFFPGAYQAKEAAKYMYDNEGDYKKNRAKYALLGAFTPATATIMKKQLEKMHKEGKSPKEIRKWMEDTKSGRVAGGVGEVGLGALSGGSTTSLATLGAQGVGLVDVITANRKSFKNRDNYTKKHKHSRDKR